jgi:hypothetical protein
MFTSRDRPEEYATLIEFALAILTVSGFQPVNIAAVFTDASCTQALQRRLGPNPVVAPVFARSLKGIAAARWVRRVVEARAKTPDRMHLTAERFVRYSRADNPSDSLMDLCISLESLLESQTEVSFRFGTCLTKVTSEKGKKAEDVAKMLSDLYDLRSKLAHGDPSAIRLLQAIQPHLAALRQIARTILTSYVLFMGEHSRSEWRQHLHTLLFA